MYLAVKLHFMSDKYDITKHRGRVITSKTKFSDNNREHLFNKFADKFDNKQQMAQYLIANFAYGAWGNTDIVYGTSEADENFKEWNRRKQSITQVFKQDISKIRLHFERNNMKFLPDLDSKFPRIPDLFQLYLGKHITLETLIILDNHHPFLDNWKVNLGGLFTDEIRRVIKARPFVKFDRNKTETIYMEFIQEF
jgi:hypothetical protein